MDSIDYYCHIVFSAIIHNDLIALQSVLNECPMALEYTDRYSNSPLLFACYCGRSQFVGYLLDSGANHKRINIFGQNALTMATYSGNMDTCTAIIQRIDFREFNSTGLLTPMCVAVLQGNTNLVKIYLRLEQPMQNQFDCPSESIHGICPMQLALNRSDYRMMELLRPTHQSHTQSIISFAGNSFLYMTHA